MWEVEILPLLIREDDFVNLRTGTIKYLVVHHTAGNERDTQAVRNYHVTNLGWDDIGYNSVIEKSGVIGKGRDVKWQGAHDVGMINGESMNKVSYGMAFIGNFSKEIISDMQFNSGVQEAIRICRLYNILPDHIRKHSDHYATECPGKLFPWEAFIKAIQVGLNSINNGVRKGLIVFSDGDLASALLMSYKTGYPIISTSSYTADLKNQYNDKHWIGMNGVNDEQNNYHVGIDRLATAKLIL